MCSAVARNAKLQTKSKCNSTIKHFVYLEAADNLFELLPMWPVELGIEDAVGIKQINYNIRQTTYCSLAAYKCTKQIHSE